MGLGPFDLTAGPFLALYAVLLVAAGLLGLFMPAWLRPPGRPGRASGIDDLAFLASGNSRMIEAALTRLYAGGALSMDDRGRFSARPGARGETALERAILHAADHLPLAGVLRQARDHGSVTDRRLTAGGLLMEPAERLGRRLLAAAPLLAVLCFGLVRLEIGMMRDKPVGFLIMLLIVTGVLALLRLALFDARTDEGRAQVVEARSRNERLRLAPTGEEAGLAVALFGTGALVGSPWSSLHSKRSGDGSGCSSSGGDGGGCGGGGCGGCGS
ncbi:MAG: TIGR04222 domain-containing membrane protein [Novosphingobium sp.]